MHDERAREGRGRGVLLRLIVLALALCELGVAAYVYWALFIDDTTSWIVAVIPDLEDTWQQMVFPSLVAGGVALVLAAWDKWLWVGLALVLAGPAVSLWLLA